MTNRTRLSDATSGDAAQVRPLALGSALGLALGRALGLALGPALFPGLDLRVDITHLGDHRRPAQRLDPRLGNPFVEVLDLLAHHRRGRQVIQHAVELEVVLADLKGRGQHADPLTLDQPLEPPVRVVGAAEIRDGLAVSGQVVEVAPRHRLLDLEVDPLGLVLHPGGRGRVAGALVASLLLAHFFRFLSGPVLTLGHRHHPTPHDSPRGNGPRHAVRRDHFVSDYRP